MLRERIHQTRRELDAVSRELIKLHLLVARVLSADDWDLIDRITTQKAVNIGDQARARQCKKFINLQKTQHPPQLHENKKTVVNLSGVPLEEAAYSALSKGLNFAVAPSSIPVKDILCGVEKAVMVLPEETAEEIRQETVRILKGSNKPKDNLTGAERRALRALKSNETLTVLPADKGNAAVVLATSDYNQKIAALLEDKTYRKLKKDPTDSIERKTLLLLKKSPFPEEICQQLRPQCSRTPRLYGLPKIHKPDVPLRPIISTIGSPTYRLAKHLASLLNSFTCDSPHHVRNSAEFVHTIKSLRLNPCDMMVSFDVVSLFTKVPIKDTMDLLEGNFAEDVLRLFRHVLTTSYFSFNGQFYEQTDGVAMGSPLSPVIANFYMKYFEERALDLAPLKPRCWFRYVDDTFVIWPHGPDNLKGFLNHLNSINPCIQFTMETESEGHLPFLDIDIYKRPDGSLGHTVYRKPTHTNLYLNAKSHHHPSSKQAALSTLVHRARALCDQESLRAELEFLKNIFKRNGYNDRQIQRALNRQPNSIQPDDRRGTVAFLPFVGTIFNRISRVLSRHNIKSVGLPPKKISNFLRPVKDHLGLRTPGIYRIPCECGKVYIGQTGRSVDTRLKEHQRHIRLEHPDKSAVAEHSIDLDHRIEFHKTAIITSKSRYLDRIILEAVEIELHPNNMNKETGFSLNKSWKPLISCLKRNTTSHSNSSPCH
ncbi:hypothetical protein B7P43_G14428 [Cryptotermes secundus]|uniref:Reverse transcriptase domain-containing protein n=1 Tax=Cryptotermes secundus TaxID=105785 RepID=A0A2J7RKT1_9NEOP|nr:hypothetical protein B7P43_G14428 [Cryptotermes secundus]